MDDSRKLYGELLERGRNEPPTGSSRSTPRASPASTQDFRDVIPDVRDGLTRRERTVLYVLDQTQRELRGRNVPTAMLWGRVCEYFYISPEALSEMLARLGARK